MNNSKREFHDMFERTYGKIYLDNAEVFSDFFNELETYYKKGTVRLADTMDTFFGILYQRMFTVINSQYNFDETYIGKLPKGFLGDETLWNVTGCSLRKQSHAGSETFRRRAPQTDPATETGLCSYEDFLQVADASS